MSNNFCHFTSPVHINAHDLSLSRPVRGTVAATTGALAIMPEVLKGVTMRDIKKEITLIMDSPTELKNATDFVMDCVADNMDFDDALEIVENMTPQSIASKTAITYGCNWSERGPSEYRS